MLESQFKVKGLRSACLNDTEIQRFELNGISMDGIPMTSGSFNAQGTVFAYAFSYDWSKGVAGQTEPPPRGIGFYCPAVSPTLMFPIDLLC